MEECLGDLHLRICLVFLDDVIVFSNTFEEHLEHLETLLLRLKDCGLKLNPKKCSFCQEKVRYVGHIISAKGIEADQEKCRKVVDWPTPTSSEEIRRFLGFAGYYRRYVKNYSKIAKPLTELMPNPKSTNGRRKRVKRVETDAKFFWAPEQEQAFRDLKEHLTSPPILGFPDYSVPFELHVDASGSGLGAVLYQEQDGEKRVISYASRGLSKSERNYSAHKLEFLALKWAVTDKFKDYLYGHSFRVFTDNNPLTYVLTTARLDATGHRWLAALSAYDFDIRYRPGGSNADADVLSRLPGILPAQQDCHLHKETVQAVCKCQEPTAYIECLGTAPEVIDNYAPTGSSLTAFTPGEIQTAQRQDPQIKIMLDSLEQYPHNKEMQKLELINGVLYRNVVVNHQPRKQLVLPSRYISYVLNSLHNCTGHPGRDRTTGLVRDRFYWAGMSKDIDKWIQQCPRCLRRKSPTNDRAPLVSTVSTGPLDLVCLDYLTLEVSKGGYHHILVMTDHFTRYAIAVPTRNQTARTTAEIIFNHFIVHYGVPKRIHTDQGTSFESRIIKELCHLFGSAKSHTTPYHPMGNGMCERFNRTLLDMLGTLELQQKQNWRSYVGPLVYAYNSTRHESTGFSPFELMFGREPHLPVDVFFGLSANDQVPLTNYMDYLRSRLEVSFDIANAVVDKAREKQKRHYDKKVRGAVVSVGDKVLVKRVAFEGKHKLSDKWEEAVYDIVAQPIMDIPVYVVQQEDCGKKRTLHRNMLLPLGRVSTDSTEGTEHVQDGTVSQQDSGRRPRTHERTRLAVSDNESMDSEDTGDEDVVVVNRSKMPRQDTMDSIVSGDDFASPHSNDDEKDQWPVSLSTSSSPPVPAPRRSVRLQLKSKNSVMVQQASRPDWQCRIDYLLDKTDSLTEMPEWMAKAIVPHILAL